jgi:hypothetical protein
MLSSGKSIRYNLKKFFFFNYCYKVLFKPFNFYSEHFFLSHSFDDVRLERTDFFQKDVLPPKTKIGHEQKIFLCYG